MFRVLQAVGASMMNPVAMSIITNTFTDPRERAQAVGVWGAVFGISMALGPIVGGTLVSSVGWRSIFLINIPVGLAAIILTLRFIPESRAPRPRRFDPVGQALVIVLLATLTYGIIEAPSRGWSSAVILAAFTASGMALVGLLLYEPRRDDPLLDLRFFRSIPFASSITISVAAFAAFGGFLFLNTLYLQDVRGLSPVDAGLATVPLAVMTVLASPLSGRIVGRRGPRLPLVISGVSLVTASAMLTGTGPATSSTWLLAAYVVFGLGFGFVNAPITNAAVSGMPRAQAGVASAIATTSRQFGQTLGVAVVGASSPRARARRCGQTCRRRARRPGGRSRPAVRSCSLLGLRGHHRSRHRVSPAHGGGAQPGGTRRVGSCSDERARRRGLRLLPRSARGLAAHLSDLVLDNQRRREVSDALGISFGRARTVRRLARKPMSMSELAAALGIDPPNATAVVDDLEALKLVRRRPHPTDRRAKLVEATRKGKDMARRTTDPRHAAAGAQRPGRRRPRGAPTDTRARSARR